MTQATCVLSTPWTNSSADSPFSETPQQEADRLLQERRLERAAGIPPAKRLQEGAQ
jgi:hypothetical protein